MAQSVSRPPKLTVWPVEITQGVRETDAGPRIGWGWVCKAHDAPAGLHGYPNDVEAFLALRDHLGVCHGRTV
jgi:hypothetical protein